jgi:hydrogenase/urease accessory protein HupE
MGRETLETTIQGLLSGLGHPIAEVDHFIFFVGFAYLLPVCSRHIFSHIDLFLGLAFIV